MRDQNDTYLMKLAFQLITRRNALWVRSLRHKYKCHDQVLVRLKNQSVSSLWRGLSVIWRDVRVNIGWSIGCRSDVDFWFDPWVPDVGPLIEHVVTHVDSILPGVCMVDMALEDGEWNWAVFRHMLPPFGSFDWLLSRGLTPQLVGMLRVGVSLRIIEWLWINLSSSDYFAKVGNNWDLRFGAVLWILWTVRNDVVFRNPMGDHESVLDRCRRLQGTMLKATASVSGAPTRGRGHSLQLSKWS
ncbi:hypothetical protein V6N13_104605 [Hibiscus sabdariffa]